TGKRQRICAILQLRLQAHEPCPVECQHRQADDHEEHDRHVGQNNSGSVVPEGPRELRALFENRPIWDHRAHQMTRRTTAWYGRKTFVGSDANRTANTTTWYGCPKVAAAQAQVGRTTRYGPLVRPFPEVAVTGRTVPGRTLRVVRGTVRHTWAARMTPYCRGRAESPL